MRLLVLLKCKPYFIFKNMFDEHAYLNPRPVRPRFSHPVPLKDKIHCVCMLIDGSTASVLPNKMLEKIKAIKGLVSDEGNLAAVVCLFLYVS